ncbi:MULTISPECIES: HNH endonuclease signature motif containing protein [Microbacterium]|uniref:HNH endonuclease n=1 Tax=Microbacterium TaxID=33882 RepID=UPI0013A5511C|nr:MULTISPECIES: HNH endonuclease signature motif containing protein [Microbacterium]
MSATPDPDRDPDPGAHDGAPEFAQVMRLVDAFEAGRRSRAVAEGAEIRVLAAAAAIVARPAHASAERARRAELDRRALVADLATSSRVSEWTVSRLLSEASDLCARFEAGVGSLERGEITRQHLAVIHDAGHAITDDAARAEFLQVALDRAATLAPGRLAPVVKVIAERFLDRTIEERHRDAAAERRIEVVDLPDDMAALTAIMPATLAHGIEDRLTQQARSVIAARGADADCTDGGGDDRDVEGDGDDQVDERTIDQLRVDIFTDTLLTAGPTECVAGTGLEAIRATVQVTLPVLTMTGATNEPALLAGYGPIDPDTARLLAAGATGWERVMTSPVTGSVLAVDRYRPGPALSRFLAARDERCRFPGCRRPVWRCDIDHTIPASEGGPTHHANLAHLCRGHHTVKGVTAWSVEQVSPGVLVWTSPSGRKHTDRPETTVRFVPDDTAERLRRTMREPWLFSADDPPGSPGAPPF